MLNKASLIIRFYIRKVRPAPIKKPEGAQIAKFSEQQLSRLGSAAQAQKISIKDAFKQKHLSFQEFEQQQMMKQMKKAEKKTRDDRQKQLYNRPMPKSTAKGERIKPEEMTLQELSSVRLGPQYLPVSFMKQAQKVFNKYGQTKLRDIALNFSKLMSVRYKEQKLDFDLYHDLKFQRLQMKLPPQRQVEQIYLIGQQKLYKEDQQEKAEQKRQVDNQTFNPEMSYSQNITISYLLNRAPRTFATAVRLMTQIKYKYPTFKPKSFIDFGGGLSAGSCAFIDIFEDSGEVYSVEPSSKMRKLSKYLTEGMKIKHFQSLGEMSTEVKQVDIVYAGYVLNQLKPDLVQVYLEALYSKTKNHGFIVLVQYGSPFGSRLIHEARKWAIDKKIYVAAPCPHQLKCPLAKSKSWCHFDQPSGIYPQNVFGKLPTDQAIHYQKFSYIILQKREQDSQLTQFEKNEPNITKEWERILFPIIKRGRHTIIDVCTKMGTFERRISSKSHGPEYKEVKKLRWGDYWRFGKRIPNKYRKERKTGLRLW